MFESLENRRLYSATVLRVADTLLIAGSAGADGIVVQQYEELNSQGATGIATLVAYFDLDNPTPDGSPNTLWNFSADQPVKGVIALLGAGNDIYDGTTAFCSQAITGGSGNDLIVTGSGNDILIGGDGDDVLYGFDGNDIIFGNNGNDEISGGEGNDLVFGGRGTNTIID